MTNTTFKKIIKRNLENGKYVLFSTYKIGSTEIVQYLYKNV
jgi:hypothetical protein